MNKEVDIDKLKWVRIFDPIHIPKYLVEQVRDRDYSVEDFYKYQSLSCVHNSEKGMGLNPFHHLYVLVNEDNIAKGFLWFNIDPLTKDIAIQVFSIDKEYWGRGRAVKKLDSHIKSIRKKAKLNKIYWITNYSKHSMKYGYKKSKSVLMEYIEGEGEDDGKNDDGRSDKRRECGPSNSSTATISGIDNGSSTNGTSGTSIQPISTAV